MIGKTLGKGTFGKVKKAINVPTDEHVAIKILEKSKIKDQSDMTRIKREIQIIRQMNHNNIVRLYSVVESPNRLYLIMEFCSQGDLFEHIVKKKRLTEPEACRIFRQIISGLKYLHSLGVAHRDIKPENILLDTDGDIKIVDFGLSHEFFGSQRLKTPCGSPCYAPPEMIKGKEYDPKQTDVWSTGVLLFAMLCGYLPFDDPKNETLYKKIVQGKFIVPKYLSADAQDLLNRMLIGDPKERIRIEQIIAHPWFGVSNHQFYLGIDARISSLPVDGSLLDRLEKEFSYSRKEIENSVKRNKCDNLCTLYYLLVRKMKRNGQMSVSDYKSSNYLRFYQQNRLLYKKYKGLFGG